MQRYGPAFTTKTRRIEGSTKSGNYCGPAWSRAPPRCCCRPRLTHSSPAPRCSAPQRSPGAPTQVSLAAGALQDHPHPATPGARRPPLLRATSVHLLRAPSANSVSPCLRVECPAVLRATLGTSCLRGEMSPRPPEPPSGVPRGTLTRSAPPASASPSRRDARSPSPPRPPSPARSPRTPTDRGSRSSRRRPSRAPRPP